MKVIKKVDVSNWSHIHKCRYCESELELSGKDIKYQYISGDFREPSYDKFYSFCAVCANEFIIPEDIIPKVLQLEVKRRKVNDSRDYGEK